MILLGSVVKNLSVNVMRFWRTILKKKYEYSIEISAMYFRLVFWTYG